VLLSLEHCQLLLTFVLVFLSPFGVGISLYSECYGTDGNGVCVQFLGGARNISLELSAQTDSVTTQPRIQSAQFLGRGCLGYD
jgi:hypothetical protein